MEHKSAKYDNATLNERYCGLCTVQVPVSEHLCWVHRTSAKSARFGGKDLPCFFARSSATQRTSGGLSDHDNFTHPVVMIEQ